MLTIDLESTVIFKFFNCDLPIKCSGADEERARPSSLKFFGKKMESGIIKQNFLTRVKLFPKDAFIMDPFNFVLVLLGQIVSIISQLLKFIELQLPMFTGLIEIKVKGHNCPISIVLKSTGR